MEQGITSFENTYGMKPYLAQIDVTTVMRTDLSESLVHLFTNCISRKLRRTEGSSKENKNALAQLISHTKNVERAVTLSQQVCKSRLCLTGAV